ncbi:hypothetical protein [Aureimonas psammosilenae]|uniref:hypothetical protein n=1 Tax=Aureimonas psammosilenae TaxID=2495496 RepID=UPI0012612231|nr:hypothetical protein [Aureimonas psammosilenae]
MSLSPQTVFGSLSASRSAYVVRSLDLGSGRSAAIWANERDRMAYEVLTFALDGVEGSASGNDAEAAEVADEADGELHAVADDRSVEDGAGVVLEEPEGGQPDEATAVEAAPEVAERPADSTEESSAVTDSAAAKPTPSSEAAAAPKFRQFQPNRRTIIPGLLSADPSMPTGRSDGAPGSHGTAR